MRKPLALVALLASFVADLLLSSFAVARVVLAPTIRTYPAIVAMPVEVRMPWAVALLACFTSLTPGSTCLHVSDDRKRLYLHLLDGRHPDASIAKFRRVYERHLLELER